MDDVDLNGRNVAGETFGGRWVRVAGGRCKETRWPREPTGLRVFTVSDDTEKLSTCRVYRQKPPLGLFHDSPFDMIRRRCSPYRVKRRNLSMVLLAHANDNPCPAPLVG